MLKVFFSGNVGDQASVKQVKEETVTEFSVAVNSKQKGQEVTTWVRCALWGEKRAGVAKYLTKGKFVCCEGSLTLREYQKDGATRTSVDCRLDDVDLGPDRGERGNAPAHTDDTNDDSVPF